MRAIYEDEIQDQLAEDELVDLAQIDPYDEVFQQAADDYADIQAGRL